MWMGTFVLGVRVLLAAVFATAGAAKLFDLPGSRAALDAFGIPSRALRTVAVALPVAELATAVALLFPSSARWGALAALTLLAAFMAGIARALARGQAPDCHCFGQIHSAPAGRGTLVRNGALVVLAALVAWRAPGPAIDDWVSLRSAAELAAVGAGILAACLGAIALRLWLESRTLRDDLADARKEIDSVPPGLPVGVPAPSFSLEDLRGQTITLGSLRARGLPVLLVFVSPSCGACRILLPDLARWQGALADRMTIAVLNGGGDSGRADFEELGVENVLLQEEFEVMNDYRLRATPAAVVVSPDGTIASKPSLGQITMEPLVRLTLGHGTMTSAQEPVLAEPPEA